MSIKSSLTAQALSKADESLRRTLKSAKKDAVLRAVLVLERDSEGLGNVDADPKPAVRPTQFSSRVDYRKALIERQASRNSAETGSTIDQLKELSLKVRGGKLTRAVVVEGSAAMIAKALKLRGVRSATLDQKLDAPRPVNS